MTIFAPATRRSLFVDWAFFDGSEISSEFVGGQCASWRFPPKAAVSACSRHSFVEGIRNGGLDVTQNRRSTRKIHFGRTKLPALQRFFSFPVGRGRLLSLIEIKKEPITTRGSDLVCYWLCVCASGSLITVILNCFTWIKVSCLHFGQNSGKFLSSVSFRIFNLVLFPQTGHNIQFSLSIL